MSHNKIAEKFHALYPSENKTMYGALPGVHAVFTESCPPFFRPIDRPDVPDAWPEVPFPSSEPLPQDQSPLFSKLPLEVRRLIYHFTVPRWNWQDIDGAPVIDVWAKDGPYAPQSVAKGVDTAGMEILYTCKRVCDEATEYIYKNAYFRLHSNFSTGGYSTFLNTIGEKNRGLLSKIEVYFARENFNALLERIGSDCPNLLKLRVYLRKHHLPEGSMMRKCFYGLVNVYGLSDRVELQRQPEGPRSSIVFSEDKMDGHIGDCYLTCERGRRRGHPAKDSRVLISNLLNYSPKHSLLDFPDNVLGRIYDFLIPSDTIIRIQKLARSENARSIKFLKKGGTVDLYTPPPPFIYSSERKDNDAPKFWMSDFHTLAPTCKKISEEVAKRVYGQNTFQLCIGRYDWLLDTSRRNLSMVQKIDIIVQDYFLLGKRGFRIINAGLLRLCREVESGNSELTELTVYVPKLELPFVFFMKGYLKRLRNNGVVMKVYSVDKTVVVEGEKEEQGRKTWKKRGETINEDVTWYLDKDNAWVWDFQAKEWKPASDVWDWIEA